MGSGSERQAEIMGLIRDAWARGRYDRADELQDLAEDIAAHTCDHCDRVVEQITHAGAIDDGNGGRRLRVLCRDCYEGDPACAEAERYAREEGAAPPR